MSNDLSARITVDADTGAAEKAIDRVNEKIGTMGEAAEKAGKKASVSMDGMGTSAEVAAAKFKRGEAALSVALRRTIEQMEIATRAGGSLAEAFQIKAEIRGLEGAKIARQIDYLRDLEAQIRLVKAAEQEFAEQQAFAKKAADTKELIKAKEYISWWIQELDKAEKEEAELAAQNAFAKKHQQAKELAKASQYASWWTQELDKAEAAERKLASEKSFINSLKAQSEAIGKTRADLLEMQAAQMGISNQAAPFIAKLREAENAMIGAGMSAKAMNAAMRGVPAQISDIVVSLQGGMSPMTVFLQQGLQLRDMFDGFIPAAKALGSTLLGLVNPYTVAAAGVVALGYAMFRAESTLRTHMSLMTQLEATGRAGYLNSDAIKQLKKDMIELPGISKSMATSIIADLVQVRTLGGEALQKIALMSADFAAATGQDAAGAAKELAKAMEDPAKAARALDEAFNFLTVEQLLAIDAMVKAGDKAGALQLLLDALGKTLHGTAEKQTNLQTASKELSNAWHDLMGNVSPSVETLNNISAGLATVVRSINSLTEAIPRLNAEITKWLPGLQVMMGPLGMWARIKGLQTSDDIAGNGAKPAFTGGASGSWGDDEPEGEKSKAQQRAVRILEDKKDLVAKKDALKDLRAELADYLALQAKLRDEKDFKTADAMQRVIDGTQEKIQSLTKTSNAGAKATESAYKTLLVAINEKIAATEKEAKTGEKLTEVEKLRLRYQEDLKTKGRQYTAQMRAKIEAGLRELEVSEQQSIAAKALAKAIEEDLKAFEKLAQQQENAVKAAEEAVNKALLEEQAYVLAASANITLAEAKEQLTLARLNEHLQMARMGAESQETIDRLEREIAAHERMLDVMQQKGIREANDKAAKEVQKDWERVSDTIGKTLADYIMGGGKDAATYIKRLFSTLVLRPIVEYGVGQLMGVNLNGMGNAAGSAGRLGGVFDGGGGSLTNWTGWGQDAGGWMMGQGWALANRGFESTGSALMSSGETVRGVDTALKGIPGMSGGLGSAAGYLGSIYALSQGQYGSAVGSAIGTWIMPGIGTMIGGALGGLLDGLFGDDDAPYYGGSAAWSAAAGTRTNLDMVNVSRQDNPASNIDNQFGSGMGWVNDSETVRNTLSGMAQGIGTALDSFAAAFGSKVGYEVALGFADDSTDDNAWGALRISQGGTDLVNWNNNRQTKWAPREFADGEEGYKQYLNAVALDVKGALQSMDLPGWADQLLVAAKDLDSINAALMQIGTIKSVFNSLGQSMDMFRDLSGDMQTQLLSASGGIDALVTNAGAFYQGLYSEAERMEALQRQLRESLGGLDINIDPAMGERAKEQFRATVEAAMAAGQSELAAKLLAMSQSFVTAADYAATAAEEAARTMKGLMSDRRQLEAELLRAIGDTAGYRAAIRGIETEGYTDAERAAWDYNRSLRDQIEAAEEAARAQEEYAQSMAQAAEEAQRAALDSAWSSVERVINRDKAYWSAIADGASQAISRISSAVDMLYRNAGDLYGSVTANAVAQAAAGMVYIENALDAVRAGASILKFKSLNDAVSAARSGINDGAYTSQFERDRDALILAGQLSELGGYAEVQQSMEEKLLDAAQTQIDLLDESLSYYRDLVAGVEHVYDAGLEAVKAANKNLEGTQYVYGAIDAQTIAQRDLTLGLGDSISTATSESARTISEAISSLTDASRMVPQEVIDQITATRDTMGAMLSLTGAIEALTSALALQQGGGSNSSSGVSWGGGSGAVDSSGAGSGGGQSAQGGYTRNFVYSGGEAPMGVSDAGEIARLDALSAIAQPFHGTGDLLGLLTTARDGGYTLSDLQAALSPMAEFKGASYSDWLKAAQSVGIPAFAVGTNYVPRDMLAQIHEGEAIVPKAFNPWAGAAPAGSNAELVAEVRALREQNAQMAARLVAIERNTQGLPQLVDQHDSVTEGGNVGRSEITNADVLAQTLAKEIAKILEDA